MGPVFKDHRAGIIRLVYNGFQMLRRRQGKIVHKENTSGDKAEGNGRGGDSGPQGTPGAADGMLRPRVDPGVQTGNHPFRILFQGGRSQGFMEFPIGGDIGVEPAVFRRRFQPLHQMKLLSRSALALQVPGYQF
jgi:hypothetical protein